MHYKEKTGGGEEKDLISEKYFLGRQRYENEVTVTCHAEADPQRVKIHSYIKNRRTQKEVEFVAVRFPHVNGTPLFPGKKFVFFGFCDLSIRFKVFQVYNSMSTATSHCKHMYSVWPDPLYSTCIKRLRQHHLKILGRAGGTVWALYSTCTPTF